MRTPYLVIENIGGNCPVQAEGTMQGLPWYFRARHERWAFCGANEKYGEPLNVMFGVEKGFFRQNRCGETRNEAGWMPLETAIHIIGQCCLAWSRELGTKPGYLV